jgi:MFS family permease
MRPYPDIPGASKSYVWMVSASYLTVSLTFPFIGRLGDIFGRRNLLILGNFIVAVGNLISALAHNVNTIIAGAVLIGLGSSMHQLGWACVGEIVLKKHRLLAMGIFECSISPGAFLGPLIGIYFIFIALCVRKIVLHLNIC